MLAWYKMSRGLLEQKQVSCSSKIWHAVLQAPVRTGTRDTATTGIRGMGTMATTAKGTEVTEDMTTLVTTTTTDMVTIAVSTRLLVKSPALGKKIADKNTKKKNTRKTQHSLKAYWFGLSAT